MDRSKRARALLPVAGALLLGSTFLDWRLAVHLEGAYLNRSVGAPAVAGFDGASNAWKAYTALAIAITRLAAVAFVVVALRARVAAAATVFAGVALAISEVGRAFDAPTTGGLGPGIVVGFGATIVAVVAAALIWSGRRPLRGENVDR